MASFELAVEKLLEHEGGYTAGLPNDPGGETSFGISKRAYPQLDIKGLTQQDAIDIYLRDYWRFDSVDDQGLANCLLDTAVNQGLSFALQIWKPDMNLRELQVSRLVRYAAILAKHPERITFMHSWATRVLDT